MKEILSENAKQILRDSVEKNGELSDPQFRELQTYLNLNPLPDGARTEPEEKGLLDK